MIDSCVAVSPCCRVSSHRARQAAQATRAPSETRAPSDDMPGRQHGPGMSLDDPRCIFDEDNLDVRPDVPPPRASRTVHVHHTSSDASRGAGQQPRQPTYAHTVVGCMAVWLCGCVAVWLCGCVAVWLWQCGCGCIVDVHDRISPYLWLFRQRIPPQIAATLGSFQVEVLFVLCGLLNGRRRAAMQALLCQHRIHDILRHMVKTTTWSKPGPTVGRLHGPGCQCNPESGELLTTAVAAWLCSLAAAMWPCGCGAVACGGGDVHVVCIVGLTCRRSFPFVVFSCSTQSPTPAPRP